jgi:asparagine synthase (glutamine-hydrolysing)
MAHSVEGRVPFLDHRLVDLTARVPSDLLLSGMREKHLLREALAGRMPEALRQRPKQGFDAPVHRWLLAEPRPGWVRASLSPEALRRVGVFRADRLECITRWLDGPSRARRRTGAWTLNLALGVQMFVEEFRARF